MVDDDDDDVMNDDGGGNKKKCLREWTVMLLRGQRRQINLEVQKGIKKMM